MRLPMWFAALLLLQQEAVAFIPRLPSSTTSLPHAPVHRTFFSSSSPSSPPPHLVRPPPAVQLPTPAWRKTALAAGKGGDVKEEEDKSKKSAPTIFRELMGGVPTTLGEGDEDDVSKNLQLQQRQQQQQQQQRLGGAPIPLPNKPNLTMIAFGVGVAVALGLVGQLVGGVVGINPVAGMSLDPQAFGLGAVLALPLFLVDAVLQYYQEDTASELYSLSIFGTRTPLIQVVALAAAMTLATGFGEEILFRGLVQQGLSSNLGGFLGLLGASLVFGLAHKLSPSDFVFIIISGLWMGLTYELTGDLTVPIALHAFYDLLILCGAYFRGMKRISQP